MDAISFGPVQQIDAGPLDVGYVDVGPPGGQPVVLLHGWPYDIHSYAEVAPALGAVGYRVIVPYLRGYGTTRFLSDDTVRNGQQSALALDVIDLMDSLGIESAIVAGFDWGARSANVVAALWPQRCKAMVSVSGYLIGNPEVNKTPLPPPAELSWWYQFYFATERGRAGYDQFRHDFAKLIWHTASPQWNFDDETFERSAASFDNPDHVDIVIHNYRWRLGLAPGEPRYDELEQQLSTSPAITVPTITLEGDANGAPHPEATAYAAKFTGKYIHRTISGRRRTQPAPRSARAVRPSRDRGRRAFVMTHRRRSDQSPRIVRVRQKAMPPNARPQSAEKCCSNAHETATATLSTSASSGSTDPRVLRLRTPGECRRTSPAYQSRWRLRIASRSPASTSRDHHCPAARS